MKDNPFVQLIKSIRNDNKAQMPVIFRFGTVISTDPIKIDVAGTIQERQDLLKNSTLDPLQPGDQVLVLPIDDEQRYVILCKVVGV